MSGAPLACVHLRAAVPSGARALRLMQRLSPDVEPLAADPQLFLLNAAGLEGLYASPEAWAQALLRALLRDGLPAAVALGHGRFSLEVLARALPTGVVRVWAGPGAAAAAAGKLPLARAGAHLALPGPLLQTAGALGLRTLGELLALPQAEAVACLGPPVRALRQAAGREALPLRPAARAEPCRAEAALEPADSDAARLLFGLKGMLPQLVATAEQQRARLRALRLTFVLEGPGTLCRRPLQRLERRLEAGRPSNREATWLELMRLLLSDWALPGPVQRLVLVAELEANKKEQLQLWPERYRRDPAATTAAIAQLRAALGPEAVTCAQPEARHLPEARFSYVPVRQLLPLRPQQAWPRPGPDAATPAGHPPLVRQVWATPRPLLRVPRQLGARLPPPGPGPAAAATGAHLRLVPDAGAAAGLPAAGLPAGTACGPHRISTGWWAAPCDRDYHYLLQPDGAWAWIFFDRQARQWRSHGMVD